MKIVPFVGIDNVRFGMLRSEVREQLGGNFRKFRKTPFSETFTDSYDSRGLHLYYDKTDKLEFIEAFAPCSIFFENISFIGNTLTNVLNELKTRNVFGRLDEPSWMFDDLGFAIINNAGKVTGVSIFCKNYYESYP